MADTNGTYRVQYAALPYRVRQDGEVQLRLVTSRETRRWVIPKGWPMKGIPPHKAAAREAYEEAGLLGSIASAPLGIYRYDKRLSATRSVLCEVMVFPMKVKRYLKKWPERSQRVGFWFSIETAASVVQEPELASLILEFGTVMAERHAQKLAKAEAAARAKAEEDKPARAVPKKKAVAKMGGPKSPVGTAGAPMAPAEEAVVVPPDVSDAAQLGAEPAVGDDAGPAPAKLKAQAKRKSRPASKSKRAPKAKAAPEVNLALIAEEVESAMAAATPISEAEMPTMTMVAEKPPGKKNPAQKAPAKKALAAKAPVKEGQVQKAK